MLGFAVFDSDVMNTDVPVEASHRRASAGSFFRQARNKSIMDHFWIGGRWGRHHPRLIFTKGKYLVGLNVVLYDMVIAQLKI